MSMTRWMILAGLAGGATLGCAGNQQDAELATAPTATLRVENDNVSTVRVSVLRSPSGAAYRLGTAPGTQVTMLQIPRPLITGVAEVTFEIQPLTGGTRRYTRTITVSPGDEIVLRIPPV